jgi:3-dehydrosphinganine reductase
MAILDPHRVKIAAAVPAPAAHALLVIIRRPMDLFEKNVIISGGSSGIGFAIAKQLARSGAHLTLLARRKDLLQEAAGLLEKEKASPIQRLDVIAADVSDFQSLKLAMDNSHQPFDVLINSAGVAYPGLFLEMDTEIFKNVMEINYLGTVNLTKLIAPGMISQKSGHIVNISSIGALLGIYGYTAYAPSKFAVRGFSHCLRAELEPLGIHVSIVYPPDTDTPQLAFERSRIPEITRKINEGGGILSPEKVAETIITGIKKKRFVIIPGYQGKIIYQLAPLIDAAMYRFAYKLASKKSR